MRSVVVTGAGRPVGQRLLPLLAAHDVVAIDSVDLPHRPGHVRFEQLDLATGDARQLDRALDGAGAVVHLGWALPGPRVSERDARGNVEGTRRLLDAADRAGISAVVHLSTATVYGAWRDNPIPLTEEAAIRPNPGAVDAVHHAEAERLAGEWADAHPEGTVAILRPATVLGPGIDTWLSRAFGGRPALRPDQADPPRQFVHVDDVARAAVVALQQRLAGAYNVAADGWVTGEAVRDLSAGRITLPIPARLAGVTADLAWNLHLSDLPPALMPLVAHPWVIANDRLRAAGWEPRYSNEEAVVAGRPGSWWREMGPSRRQQVTLASSATLVVGVAAGAVALAARARRRATG